MTAIGVTNREGDYNHRTEAAPHDLEAEFARLDADPPGALDAAHDLANMPLPQEPQRVRDDLDAVSR